MSQGRYTGSERADRFASRIRGHTSGDQSSRDTIGRRRRRRHDKRPGIETTFRRAQVGGAAGDRGSNEEDAKVDLFSFLSDLLPSLLLLMRSSGHVGEFLFSRAGRN